MKVIQLLPVFLRSRVAVVPKGEIREIIWDSEKIRSIGYSTIKLDSCLGIGRNRGTYLTFKLVRTMETSIG